MPFKSEKQERFFQAIAHGWKPTRRKGPSQAVARKFIKDAERGKARGGALRYAYGGAVRDPLRVGPRSARGALGSLGSTAKVGGLGDALAGARRPRSGFAAGPRAAPMRPGAALSGRPLPRPGRGSNGVLALAGTPWWLASDRISRTTRTR